MTQHELVLLSPYRYPGQSSLLLADEDMAAWLNAYTVLWHPSLLWNAKAPPRCDAQYDHEQPRAGFVYALPESPPLYLPDDWEEKVRAAGSISFRAGGERAAALENLRTALEAAGSNAPGWPSGVALESEQVSPYFGLGLGHLLQTTLAEAMEHENLVDAAGFWDDVQQAVARLAGFAYTPTAMPVPAYNPETAPYPAYDNYEGATPADGSAEASPPEPLAAAQQIHPDPLAAAPASDEWRDHLRNAAQKLLSARESFTRWPFICWT